MKFRDVLLFLLKTPSRWIEGMKLLFSTLAGNVETTICADGVCLVCGTGRGEGVWCALRGLDYEPELRLFLKQLKRGDIVVDLGANIGAYAIRSASSVAPEGKVHAFEPLERTRKRLEKAVRLNGTVNVSIHAEAVGNQSGYATLGVKHRGSSASLAAQAESSESHTVRVTTLDEFAEAHGISRIDWIKMDIEGAEPMALEGMRRTIAACRPNFLFENESGGARAAGILRELGYKVGVLEADGDFRETAAGHSLFAYPREHTGKETRQGTRS